MIWVEGVTLALVVGACGMWKEEEDGVGCGLPAWIGEAEECEGGSPARKRRRYKQGVKVSTWKGRGKRGNLAFGKGEGAGR